MTAVTTAGLLAGLFGSAFVPAARAAAGDGFNSVPGTPILEVIEQPWFSSTGITNKGEVAHSADVANTAVLTAVGGTITDNLLTGSATALDTVYADTSTTVRTAGADFALSYVSATDRVMIFYTPTEAVSTSSTLTYTVASAGAYAFAAQSATPVARVSSADVIGTNSGSQVAATGNYVVITLGDGLALGSTSTLDIAVANGTVPTTGLVAGTATLARTDSTNLQVPASAATELNGAGTASSFRVTYGGSSTSTITFSGVKDASGVLTRATLQTITITWTAAAVSGVPTTADSDAGIDDDAGWAAAAEASAATVLAEDCSRATLGCDAKAATASATSVFFGAVYAYDGNEAVAGDTTKKWSMSLSGTAGQLKLASGAFTRSAEVAFAADGRTTFEIAGNGIAGNTTLTITYGGVTFASFTVSFYGTVDSVAKYSQDNYAIVKTDGTTTNVLTVKGLDSAGVSVDLTLADGAPSVADSRFTATESLGTGRVSVLIDCNGYTGTSTATWTLTGKNAISTTFTCSTNAVSDINVSFETASVAVGGTAYVVVELLDAAGLPVPDAVTLAQANYKSIAVANGLINPSSLLTTSALTAAPDAAAATGTKLTVENGKFKIPFYATTGGTGTFTMTVATAEWDASAPLADVTYTASIKIGTSANSIEAGPKKKVATANFGATAAGGRIAFTIENAAGTTRTYYRKANASGVATYTINRAGTWTVYASYGDDITDSVTLKK